MEESCWHRVTFYDWVAEIADEYVKKRNSIYVDGRFRYCKYTGPGGGRKGSSGQKGAGEESRSGGAEATSAKHLRRIHCGQRRKTTGHYQRYRRGHSVPAEIHQEQKMTRDQFIEELNAKGFCRINTISGKWQAAWFLTRDAKTLVMLVRAGGVDLRLTDLSIEEMANPQGLLSVSMQRLGDLVGEYHFHASGTGVHERACQVAHWFCQGEAIPADAWTKVGMSRKAWASEQSRDADMKDVYNGIGHGDGEPIYLEGGVMLFPDGTMKS